MSLLNKSQTVTKITPSSASSNVESTTSDIQVPQDEYNTLKSLASEKGVETAWQYVKDTYGTDSPKQLEAHELAHYVGKLIYEEKGLAGMTICSTDFAFGCYHGLLDQAFRKDLSSLQQAEKACESVGIVKSGPYASCIHGIGHGIASYFKDNDLKNALKACDKLPEGAPQFCYDGVFMEFSRDAVDSFYRSDDPLYPCNAVDPKYTFACGRNQSSLLMSRMHLSYEEVAKTCQKSNDTNLKNSCFVALGFQAVYKANADPEKIITTCQTLNDKNFEYQCKSAAAGELIFQDMTDWQVKSPKICNSLPKDKQNNCLGYIKNIENNYNRK